MGVEPRRAYRALPGGNTTARPERRPARRARWRPAWGVLYGMVAAMLVLGFACSLSARTEQAEGMVEFGTAGAVFAAMAVWVRRNRVALDCCTEDARSTEDAGAPRMLIARIVRSRRPEVWAVTAPEAPHHDQVKRVVPLRPRRAARASNDAP